jgi:hypothetical protein
MQRPVYVWQVLPNFGSDSPQLSQLVDPVGSPSARRTSRLRRGPERDRRWSFGQHYAIPRVSVGPPPSCPVMSRSGGTRPASARLTNATRSSPSNSTCRGGASSRTLITQSSQCRPRPVQVSQSMSMTSLPDRSHDHSRGHSRGHSRCRSGRAARYGGAPTIFADDDEPARSFSRELAGPAGSARPPSAHPRDAHRQRQPGRM